VKRDVVILKLIQERSCLSGQGTNFFDGKNIEAKFREQSRLVPRPGADLEYFLFPFELERFRHTRDYKRLGESLLLADGESAIIVGTIDQAGIYEQMPGNLAQGLDNSRIVDAARNDLLLNHSLSGPGKVWWNRIGEFHFDRGEDQI